jgi:hypothetical protein
MTGAERSRLAAVVGVEEDDLDPIILRAYADELDEEGHHAYAERVHEVAEEEELELLYANFAASFHVPGGSPPERRYASDSDDERAYTAWATFSGVQLMAVDERELEAHRLLADPDAAACHDFLTTGRGGLDALAACYAGDDVSPDSREEDALYERWRSRFG